MSGNLDKTRYIELLKKIETLKNKRYSFFKENKIEYYELASYQKRLGDQFCYNHKENYLSLIRQYRTGRISASGFQFQFREMDSKDLRSIRILEKYFEKLAAFSIDSKSKGFSSLRIKISKDCDALFEDGFTENQFRYVVEKVFVEIEKFLKN